MTDRITLDLNASRTPVSPDLYGVFFEEINHAGEGGLYAEMVQNRDFEATRRPAGTKWAGNLLLTERGWYERKWFGNALHGWSLVNEGGGRGSIHLDASHPLNAANPQAMRLEAASLGTRLGVANDGYWGMCVRQDQEYDLSFYARTEGDARVDLTVSLFPRCTFRQRPNGLRPDLAGMLEDLNPAFVRFPGGAVVGGLTLDNRVQWKHSIGDIASRTGTANLWGYYSTNGMGYHEYLQLCDDLAADALWVCNPGMADSYRRGETVSGDALQPYVQEALDALEYALGSPDTEWGARRAANGREEPFGLRYIEIGNEAGGEVYRDNYRHFYRAIREAYPDLAIIGLERNGDVVRMSSYAPLFYNVNDVAWPVNLIGFDNARAVGRSSGSSPFGEYR